MFTISLVFLLILLVIFNLSLSAQHNNANTIAVEHKNAIVTNIWLDDEARLDKIRNNNIKYLIVDVGGTDKNGNLLTPKEDIVYFLNFINKYEQNHSYSFILLPYSEINTETYNITNNFENNFIVTYCNLTLMGFDGVFVDIEPVKFNYRNAYLLLIDKLRQKLSKEKIISVYSGHIAQRQDTNNYWEWNNDFLKKVSEKADIISVPVYDTSYKTKKDYQNYVINSVDTILKNNWSSYFFLGVPTHKEYPETLANAMDIYSRETKKYNSGNLGVAIFAEWTIDNNEWKTFSRYLS